MLEKIASIILAFIIALAPTSVYATETEKPNDATNLLLSNGYNTDGQLSFDNCDTTFELDSFDLTDMGINNFDEEQRDGLPIQKILLLLRICLTWLLIKIPCLTEASLQTQLFTGYGATVQQIIHMIPMEMKLAEAIEDSGIIFSAEDIVIGGTFGEDVFGLNTELNYSPEIQTYGAFQGSDYIYHSDTLTSDDDAVDFYLFTLSGTKTALLTLQTTADYIAIICPYDPATGDINVSTSYPYVLKGESRAFVDVNDDSQNTFCLVVMNLGSEYGSTYTVGMNATNPEGATVIEYASSDLSRAVCRYSNGYVYSNGNNITLAAADFIVNKMNGTVFEDQYKSGSPSYQVANVGVVSQAVDIEGDTLYYGSYVSTNNNINLKNNLKHSSDNVIFVPINGYEYVCSISGTYIPFQVLRDVATGFLP